MIRRVPRSAEACVVYAFVLACLIGLAWGLPGTDSWASDAISPRSCGLGAIVLTYLPGRFHHYPPLHMLALTVLSLPWIALAALRAGTSSHALEIELIKPFYMTAIELSARAVAVAMGAGIVVATMRLWSRLAGRRAGIIAGLLVGADAVLVYYAHTGNLEVPSLFWVTWGLVEVDRVACGERRETRAILIAVAAALTKDQAAAAFVFTLPTYILALPWRTRGERRDPGAWMRLARATMVGIIAYALVSGAAVNPRGFRARLDVLFGPASRSWTPYPPGADGVRGMLHDAFDAIPHFTSWPLALLVPVGIVVLALRTRGSVDRARSLMPLVAAVSFTVLFTLAARRTEDRFLLPQMVLLVPYAAVPFDALLERASRWRARVLVFASLVVALVPALIGVGSMDATLLADARIEAERYLARLPPGTPVDVIGGSPFLPRIPAYMTNVARPGVEPIDDRRRISGVEEIVDLAMDPMARTDRGPPDVIVLATELSHPVPVDPPKVQYGVTSYRDPVSRRFFTDLEAGRLDYERVLRATCTLPAPLTCRKIHDSTGAEVWIYARRGFLTTSARLAR